MRLVILATLVLLCLFATLSFTKNGEILEVITGGVQSCEVLGGSTVESLSHATIKTANGSYIISSLRNCSAGAKVNIFIKRGALYFNTIYVAEEL